MMLTVELHNLSSLNDHIDTLENIGKNKYLTAFERSIIKDTISVFENILKAYAPEDYRRRMMRKNKEVDL